MRVLIGYECSGVVREAFRKQGHDAWSCDLQEARDGSPHHLQCDVFDIVGDSWDMAVFHPMCTYLTVSAAWAYKDGPFHMKIGPDVLTGQARRDAREKSLDEVRRLLALPYPKAIENPGASFISKAIRPADQRIQPYQYGHDASKLTGLWLDGLPKLRPTGPFIEPRIINGKKRWGNQSPSGAQNLPPSDDRWQIRSETYPGIAAAMAKQWGNIERA